jgi:hypothetical protein
MCEQYRVGRGLLLIVLHRTLDLQTVQILRLGCIGNMEAGRKTLSDINLPKCREKGIFWVGRLWANLP